MIDTATSNSDSKIALTSDSKPKNNHFISSKQYAEALLLNGFNRTKAYKSIVPDADQATAEDRGTALVKRKAVQDQIETALSKQGLGIDNLAKYLNISLVAGLGKKATNKDSISALRLLYDIYNRDKTDLEASQAQDLELLSSEELRTRLDAIGTQIKKLKREGAIEGDIVTHSK